MNVGDAVISLVFITGYVIMIAAVVVIIVVVIIVVVSVAIDAVALLVVWAVVGLLQWQ